MANGFSGTMDWILPDFAEAFSLAGFATLIFDYRYLGVSDGEPRQLIDPEEQLKDLKNAIDFIRNFKGIDVTRIALWGTSLGGSHVFNVAASDSRIAAVIGNMPAIDAVKGANVAAKMRDARATKLELVTVTMRLLSAAVTDSIKGWLGRTPLYLKVYGKPGKAVFTDPALAASFENVERNCPTWQNKFAARFLLKAPRYKEGTFEKIRVPILLTLATDDVEVSIDYVKEKASRAVDVEINEYVCGHFDIYHGEMLTRVTGDQLVFLKKTLQERS
jgi:alpha-beta hydrolase superfamily lysophospholipase